MSEKLDHLFKTEIRNQKVAIGWEIVYIDRFLNFGKTLKSEKICTDKIMAQEWQLILNITESDNISFCALNTGEQAVGHMFSITCSILNSQHQRVYTKHIGFLRNIMETCKEYGHLKFIPKADLEEQAAVFMPNNILKLYIEIEYYLYVAENLPYLDQFSPASNAPCFEPLFDNHLFSDVMVYVGKQSFPAHKAILSSKSPVFLRYFETHQDMKVYNANSWSFRVVRKMVEWIYKGQFQGDEPADDEPMLDVANTFNLWDLKLLMEVKLAKTIAPETAIELLNIAQKCEAKLLKSKAIKYIVKHTKTFVDRPDFKKFLLAHPNLLSDLFKTVNI